MPISVSASTPPNTSQQLEDWLRSYRPQELFDDAGRLRPELAALAPEGARRMGANPHANGGMLLRDLRLPDFRDYAVAVAVPGVRGIGDTRVLGPFLRDVHRLATRHGATSASSVRTRRSPTAWRRCSR